MFTLKVSVLGCVVAERFNADKAGLSPAISNSLNWPMRWVGEEIVKKS